MATQERSLRRDFGTGIVAIGGLIVLAAVFSGGGSGADTARPADTRPALTTNDIPSIADTAYENKPRFQRDYENRRFDGTLRFKSIDTTFGQYQLHFQDPDAYCFVTDGEAQSMVNWQRGRPVHVTGSVSDVVLHDVHLDGCSVS
jgi:hypothetical protein